MTKNELKHYSSLLKKKTRDEKEKFIAEGIKIIREGVKDSAWKKRCEAVIVSHRFTDEHQDFIEELRSYNIIPAEVSEQDINRLSDTVTPQGIVAVFTTAPDQKLNNKKISSGLTVALENINDPGNLGTIIRNCDWFGVKDIILSANCADVYNSKTIRSCMGSLFHVNLYRDVNLPAFCNDQKASGSKILCADLNGQDIFNYKLNTPSVIIFANEANGPSEEILALTDEAITINKLGQAESLNVASASAVILAELTKS
jgi:RNA methyltransferase, TrmH family